MLSFLVIGRIGQIGQIGQISGAGRGGLERDNSTLWEGLTCPAYLARISTPA
jgi:hypothetical protein